MIFGYRLVYKKKKKGRERDREDEIENSKLKFGRGARYKI